MMEKPTENDSESKTYNGEPITTASGKQTAESLQSEIQQLEAQIRHERDLRRKAEDHFHTLQKENSKHQWEIEVEEEAIANKLIKSLAEVKHEKEKLALQIEQEEEYLTNTLQLKLDKLRKEKIEMENQLEMEQELVVNTLQKQMDQLRLEKVVLQKKLKDLQDGTYDSSSHISLPSMDSISKH